MTFKVDVIDSVVINLYISTLANNYRSINFSWLYYLIKNVSFACKVPLLFFLSFIHNNYIQQWNPSLRPKKYIFVHNRPTFFCRPKTYLFYFIFYLFFFCIFFLEMTCKKLMIKVTLFQSFQFQLLTKY